MSYVFLRKLLRHVTNRLINPSRGWIAFVLSYCDFRKTVTSYEDGQGSLPELGERVVVFCHFDPEGIIRDYTRTYIDSLKKEGLDIVFVTNSPRLLPSDHKWIRLRANRLVFRRNIGYDFAAWRDAMDICGLPSVNTRFLLIANDSVYGPLYPLGPVLQQMDFADAHIWGATDSWEHRFHVQSYFFAFGEVALRHPAFAKFWSSVKNVQSKWWVIRRYEVGMAQTFIAAGLRCKAIWAYMDMIEGIANSIAESADAHPTALTRNSLSVDIQPPHKPNRQPNPFVDIQQSNSRRILDLALRQVPLNPTAHLWQFLLESGFPFIKRELLRYNPAQISGVTAWSPLVRQIDSQSHAMILSDLEKSVKNRAP